MDMAARKMLMIDPQTWTLLPNSGANNRLETISRAISTAAGTNTMK